MTTPEPLVEVKDLSYSYDGLSLALDSVNLVIRDSSTYVLVGANGSGKTTLAQLLVGSLSPTSGTITRHPRLARHDNSIRTAFVQQHLSIYDTLTVAQNFAVVSSDPGSRAMSTSHGFSCEVANWLKVVGSNVDPHAIAGTLSFSDRQLIEIARALYQQVPLIILDEPTAGLDVKSRDRLFTTLNVISTAGTSILLVTHDFGDVARLGGKIIRLEEGRRVESDHADRPSHRVSLEHAEDTASPWGLISFCLPAAGLDEKLPILQGKATVAVFDDALNRSSVWLSLAGFETDSALRTQAVVNHSPVVPLSAAGLRRHSVHLLPADRQRYGLFPLLSVADNLRLLMMDSHFLVSSLPADKVAAVTDRLGVVMPTQNSPMKTLSGGNQQKVLLAGLLESNPLCTILEEPVLGMDDSSRQKALTLLATYLTQGGTCVIFTCFPNNYEPLPDHLKLVREVQ